MVLKITIIKENFGEMCVQTLKFERLHLIKCMYIGP